MVKLRIVNVVATASLKQPIDIVSAGRFGGFIHDSKKLGGRVTYFKSEEMRGRVAIFPSGKMISVGSVSLKDAIDNFMMAMNALVSNKLAKPTILDATIQNIVATVDFERRIDLEYLSTKFGAIYEPEQFPAAILRLESPKASVLFFESGKTVVLGTQNVKNLNEAVTKISELLDSVLQLSEKSLSL